jgi:hypothetical protein
MGSSGCEVGAGFEDYHHHHQYYFHCDYLKIECATGLGHYPTLVSRECQLWYPGAGSSD